MLIVTSLDSQQKRSLAKNGSSDAKNATEKLNNIMINVNLLFEEIPRKFAT